MKTEQRIAKLLKKQAKTLAVAESCTGGLVSHRITNVPGSSEYFKLGLVTYANEAKTGLLKVPANLINSRGAVSLEVAKLMAQNIRRIAKADFGIGLTGIAGPTGATKTKPVGLIYIAVASDRETAIEKFNFKGSRIHIKALAAAHALKLLEKFL